MKVIAGLFIGINIMIQAAIVILLCWAAYASYVYVSETCVNTTMAKCVGKIGNRLSTDFNEGLNGE